TLTGCAVALLYTEGREHEETCEFWPYSCPCLGPYLYCTWQGSLEQVMRHLMVCHNSIESLQGEDDVFSATDINKPVSRTWVKMQTCFGHHFRLLLEKRVKWDGCQQFFAIVQLIGSRKQVEKFAYRLELKVQRRHLTWESTPRSIHEPVFVIIMNSDCMGVQ
ncbi:E3 ubiquitin-protein ligase SIAH1A-like, partial [Cryptotermes secundus]|uniref:E3 ubiquitin-protein ligase SIAH1A-like n=1 Tax=Cryptotermes secundus TaxID=105785 RepID=UPI000CD7AAEC